MQPLPPISPAKTVAKPHGLQRYFWLSPKIYFPLTVIAALLTFWLIWSVLAGSAVELEWSWLLSGVPAFALIGFATAVREVLLRRAQHELMFLHSRPSQTKTAVKTKASNPRKFTLEQNATVLLSIQQKSDLANTSDTDAAKHHAAYLACQNYLETVERELATIHVSSPRLPALRKGHERAKTLHQHHLTRWAAEEARTLMREANVKTERNDKIEAARRALETLQIALQIYPNEQLLQDSTVPIREYVTSQRVSHYVEQAERYVFREQYQRAIDRYRDAQFFLSREAFDETERSYLTQKIESEISCLNLILERNSAK